MRESKRARDDDPMETEEAKELRISAKKYYIQPDATQITATGRQAYGSTTFNLQAIVRGDTFTTSDNVIMYPTVIFKAFKTRTISGIEGNFTITVPTAFDYSLLIYPLIMVQRSGMPTPVPLIASFDFYTERSTVSTSKLVNNEVNLLWSTPIHINNTTSGKTITVPIKSAHRRRLRENDVLIMVIVLLKDQDQTIGLDSTVFSYITCGGFIK